MGLRLSQLSSYKHSLKLGVFVLMATILILTSFGYPKKNVEIQNTPQTNQVHAMDRALPQNLIIEKLNISAPIIDLGLDPKGALEVPKEGTDAGWYINSPTPGEMGASVIAGHYDWENGPALFYKLKNLKVGDEIKVKREDGSTAKFIVERTEQYEQNKFPTLDVYGPTSEPTLRLITCAGSYSKNDGRYSHNYVVFAKLAP